MLPATAVLPAGNARRVGHRVIMPSMISPVERAAILDVVDARTRGMDALTIDASRRLRAEIGMPVPPSMGNPVPVVTPEVWDSIAFTRAAKDHQRAVCDDAAAAVDVIFDPVAGREEKQAAWLDLQEFIGGELGIDVHAMPPSILKTSSPEDIERIEVPDYFDGAFRILPLHAWHNERRIGWAKRYVKRALMRDSHRLCVRALARMRSEDEVHRDVDDLLTAPDVSFEPMEVAQTNHIVALGCDRLLDTLRSSPRADDRELAADIEAWFTVGKGGMGDSRYQRMRYRLKSARMRALAQRLGFEPVSRSTESQITRCGERKVITLAGAGPLLPFGGCLPGWQSCYRTEDSASLW